MKKIIGFTCVFLLLVIQIGMAGNLEKKEGKAAVNNIKIFYKIMGSGEPVFVLHGGPGMFHDYFLPYMEKLAKQYTLVFYDQRGNGQSLINISVETYTFDLHVKDLEELRKSLGFKKIHLMGHSFGGYLAMRYAIKYSQNLKSLILLNTAPASRELLMKSQMNRISRYTEEERTRIQSMFQKMLANPEPEALTRMLHLTEKVSLHDPKKIGEIFSRVKFNEETARNLMAINRLQGQLLAAFDIHDQLDKISAPTLIITGESDFMVPESSQAIQKKIKGSRLTTIKKSGHYPFAENPDDFFKAVKEFLTKVDENK
jgi:proline iminopeptidase